MKGGFSKQNMTNEFNNISVVIPSYDPDEKLLPTIEGLISEGFTDIIIIDDGSKAETKKFFPKETENITVLVHEVNKGKGAGLKTAFRYILDNRPDSLGCVTADSDGQHKPSDIAECVRAMIREKDKIILGSRDFSLPHVPAKSRKGNRITSAVFKLLFGMKISDTQTGLRAFPKSVLGDMLEVRGDRYEYETNMLISMKRNHIGFAEVKIETVYINGNETSHFRPVRDSIRIYGLICAFALSSVLSFVVDIGIFTLLNFILSKTGVNYAYFVSVVCARVISAAVNYTVNRKVVFGTGNSSSVSRYFILAFFILVISAGVGQFLTNVIAPSAKILESVIKAVVDTILFLLSFKIQNEWVFGKKTPKDK